jgi:hypothetical protein
MKEQSMKISATLLVPCALLAGLAAGDAWAAREVRGGARTSVNHNANANRNVNQNVNRNVNVNQNVNRSVSVNQHVDVDVDVDHDYHPFATAAAVTTAAVVTSAVVGSIVHSIPPSCQTVVVAGVTYSQCGSTWYMPQMQGSSVTYVVVAPPR